MNPSRGCAIRLVSHWLLFAIAQRERERALCWPILGRGLNLLAASKSNWIFLDTKKQNKERETKLWASLLGLKLGYLLSRLTYEMVSTTELVPFWFALEGLAKLKRQTTSSQLIKFVWLRTSLFLVLAQNWMNKLPLIICSRAYCMQSHTHVSLSS